jgi:hypothetical protein
MNGEEYETGELYSAPYFSHDAVTDCHPGLYIAGGQDCEVERAPRILVAFWMDELLVTAKKARVPRFRTVESIEEFNNLTAQDMEVTEDD